MEICPDSFLAINCDGKMNIGLHLRIFILRDMKTRNCVGPFIICCAPCSSSPITCQTNEALFMCFKEHTLQEHFLWHWDIFIFLMSLDNSHFMGVTVQKALRYEVLCMNGYSKTDLKVSGAGTCTKIELIFRSDKRKNLCPLTRLWLPGLFVSPAGRSQEL
ncbi:hypothetical protein OTU49_006881 [Cherax quadricarinatus]|uniref:Uncharacterized protein n=1 Tax=Cherax quadricarinatus TaxID=27406 RepID=A0AAW0X0I8_CHEQU